MTGRFPPKRGGGEVVVHGVEPTEKRAEVLVAERDQQGKPDRGAERRPAADPVPHAQHVLRRHPYALPGFESSRYPYDVTREVGVRSERRDQPLARRMCVLDRLERRHRLRDDDEERLGRIEILRRHGKVVRVHVRDETHGELGRRIRLERCVRHRRAEIASADTDVDDRPDTPACRPQPLSRPHRLRERGHAIELVVDLPDDVHAVHHQRPRARHPQGDMERRATLGDVHPLTAEHRVHLLREPALRRELPQKLEGVVGDAMLRVVEIEAGRLGGQPLAARRIGVEEIPELQALDFSPVPLQPAPDGSLYEGLSHGAAQSLP